MDIEHDFFNKSTSLIVTHGERRKDYFADPAPPGEDDGEAEGETSLLPPLDPPADGASSFAGAVFNLANSTIGAGALGLPLVMKSCGIVLGTIFLAFFAYLSDYSLSLLHKSSQMLIENRKDQKYIRTRNYEDIAEALYGHWLAVVVKLFIILVNFGACISYLIIIGDLLTSSIGERIKGTDEFMWEYFYIERVFIVAFIAIFILFPLSITEKMQSLRFISLISIFSILGFIGVVVVYYFAGDIEQYQEGSISLFNFDLSIFSVLSTCTFAFACHTSLLPVSKDFQDPSGMQNSIHASVTLSYTTYSVIAFFGYISFYENTKGNILLSYPEDDIFIDIIKVLVAISIILTFPTVLFPSRVSLDNIIFPDKDIAPHPWLQYFIGKDRLRTMIATAMLIVPAYILSITLPGVTIVFSLTGSTASTCCSYLFPGWFYLKLSERSWKDPRSWPVILLLVFGLIFGTISTVIIILDLFIEVP